MLQLQSLAVVQIGDVAEGTVQSIKPYGAFIELGGGLSGLLHISQISFDRVTNVGGVLAEGDKLKVGAHSLSVSCCPCSILYFAKTRSS